MGAMSLESCVPRFLANQGVKALSERCQLKTPSGGAMRGFLIGSRGGT